MTLLLNDKVWCDEAGDCPKNLKKAVDRQEAQPGTGC
jgi:hypothetical protein